MRAMNGPRSVLNEGLDYVYLMKDLYAVSGLITTLSPTDGGIEAQDIETNRNPCTHPQPEETHNADATDTGEPSQISRGTCDNGRSRHCSLDDGQHRTGE